MAEAHHRKKDPDHVRQSLIDHALRIVAADGYATLGVQEVASAAGVTKGGFFHHFANKKAFLDAVFAEMLKMLDQELDQRMAMDPVPQGSFTRAYLEHAFAADQAEDNECSSVLALSFLSDAHLRGQWLEWFHQRLLRHQATDDTPALEAVRMAVDGVWLADLTGTGLNHREQVKEYLLKATHPQPNPQD